MMCSLSPHHPLRPPALLPPRAAPHLIQLLQVELPPVLIQVCSCVLHLVWVVVEVVEFFEGVVVVKEAEDGVLLGGQGPGKCAKKFFLDN